MRTLWVIVAICAMPSIVSAQSTELEKARKRIDKLSKTPCVCRDGSVNEGRAGLIANGGTSTITEITIEPYCNILTYAPDGSLYSSGGCRPFTPLSR